MTTRVGINGFGRIGRSVVRALHEQGADLEVVAANDVGPVDQMAHLLRFDSVYGRFPGKVRAVDGGVQVDDHVIRFLAEREPRSTRRSGPRRPTARWPASSTTRRNRSSRATSSGRPRRASSTHR